MADVGKGEIAHDQQLLLFPKCFLPYQKIIVQFHHILKCRGKLVQFGTVEDFAFGKGLKVLV